MLETHNRRFYWFATHHAKVQNTSDSLRPSETQVRENSRPYTSLSAFSLHATKVSAKGILLPVSVLAARAKKVFPHPLGFFRIKKATNEKRKQRILRLRKHLMVYLLCFAAGENVWNCTVLQLVKEAPNCIYTCPVPIEILGYIHAWVETRNMVLLVQNTSCKSTKHVGFSSDFRNTNQRKLQTLHIALCIPSACNKSISKRNTPSCKRLGG